MFLQCKWCEVLRLDSFLAICNMYGSDAFVMNKLPNVCTNHLMCCLVWTGELWMYNLSWQSLNITKFSATQLWQNQNIQKQKSVQTQYVANTLICETNTIMLISVLIFSWSKLFALMWRWEGAIIIYKILREEWWRLSLKGGDGKFPLFPVCRRKTCVKKMETSRVWYKVKCVVKRQV